MQADPDSIFAQYFLIQPHGPDVEINTLIQHYSQFRLFEITDDNFAQIETWSTDFNMAIQANSSLRSVINSLFKPCISRPNRNTKQLRLKWDKEHKQKIIRFCCIYGLNFEQNHDSPFYPKPFTPEQCRQHWIYETPFLRKGEANEQVTVALTRPTWKQMDKNHNKNWANTDFCW